MHHEERVAGYLCRFAERLHLSYKRDAENCIVISKPTTPGHEEAEPIVLLNHMDMVGVGMSDPLNSPIDASVEDGWTKARGTSLGDDNGIGLSMALAMLESNEIMHGPMESGLLRGALSWHPDSQHRPPVHHRGHLACAHLASEQTCLK